MIDLEIINKTNCTGCHACANTCKQDSITMESDEEGFLYPSVNQDRCIGCRQCIEVCPIINKIGIKNKPKAYACMNKNDSVRLSSSSGGLFTLFAEEIIKNDGVVFGARFNENHEVIHDFALTANQLDDFRGSKYVQSKIGSTFKQLEEFIGQGKKVLYSGTPCQIGGLSSYLRQSHENLYCIDIICHGVPSPKVWDRYLAYQEKSAQSRVKRIAFRLKDEGWKQYSVSLLFENDTEYRRIFNKDLFMKAFLDNVCLRPSCYMCAFKSLRRQSDITLADFWGIQNICPEMDDDKGTSLVFINSEKGQSMFEKIENHVIYKETDIDKAIQYNSTAIKSVALNPKRENFFLDLYRLPFNKLVDKFCSESAPNVHKRKVKSVLREILKKTGLFPLIKKN